MLTKGTPVYSADEQPIGKVVHVLAAEHEDLFEGIVVAEPGGTGHRFADAELVGAIHERGVTLTLPADACRDLPRPSPGPAVMRADPAERGEGALTAKLHRAWDLVSGRY